ncbi:MAG: GTP-binding protein [Candidatus Heimdallarchaeota archaeon]
MSKKIVLKMILCGDGAVGKTSLVKRYIDHTFQADYRPVMGVDITSKDVKLEDGREVTISIHDIGGQERWSAFRDRFYRGAHLAMFVYDLTRPESLESLTKTWIPEFLKFAPVEAQPHPPKFIIIGNKSDLKQLLQVSKRKGTSVAKKTNAIGNIRTSAKDDVNVEKAFVDLITAFLPPNK